MTVETLKDSNKKALAQLAKERGVAGWHAMRKDQLIRALTPLLNGKSKSKGSAKPRIADLPPPAPAPLPPPRPALAPPLRLVDNGCIRDRIVAMVRDAFWLHAHWELSRSTLQRAQVAMGNDWHTARPILRLVDVTSDDNSSTSERPVRDIDIHGGVNSWYIDVTTPARSYRIDIGYISRRGKFYVLARSNNVTMPKSGSHQMLDENWASVEEQFQRAFLGGDNVMARDLQSMFEDRLRRPLGSQSITYNGIPCPGRKFHFEIDAELVVYGATEPNARVTLLGEEVKVKPDGTFSVRFSLPDSRQIIPAVSSSPDGVEERTIVLAVERNTKELEPMIHDGNEF